ncbi:HNH endonuclease [Devosia sp. YIM 151766]|uniref:HNH endonuclease n=1 Tax=Devosia sp. YIM 151766 TaxID=3017325 RepID=UPI00255C75AC|nr:HNH endonuclease [Devosia sp. YIM 151766]WIY54104.1 HNH endonuclease [Devosia sp. YIM 151766]
MKLTKAETRIIAKDPDAARLTAKVVFRGDGCWEWTGAKNAQGYGYLAFRGKTWKAHRVSYTIFCGEIPDGLMVCHHCDNPCCVNPRHLFLGHATVNMKDMVRKGRGKSSITSEQSHFKAGRPPRGEEAGGHKLTEALASEILHAASAGVLTSDLAAKYSLDRSTIQRLLRGETWRHLKRPSGLPRPHGVYNRSAGRSALTQEGER